MTAPAAWPSVNKRAQVLVERLVDAAEELRIAVERQARGHLVIDAGIRVEGGLDAGIAIAEICMGGLGSVRVTTGCSFAHWPLGLTVISSHPVLACLGSQYAGWSLAAGDGETAFHALGSGPGRALAVKEPLFAELGYRDRAETAVLVLEVDRRPPDEVVEKILADCAVEPAGLTLILTPTNSLAGTTQVVARVLEVALHKAHELGFPLRRIVEGAASVPLPPPAPEFLDAMGRTNDAIIFGGWVQLQVDGPEDEARALARRLPSRASRDYGRPFAEIFKAVKGDFYAIDPLLFSPARVTVTARQTGRSFFAGNSDEALLDASFGVAPGDLLETS